MTSAEPPDEKDAWKAKHKSGLAERQREEQRLRAKFFAGLRSGGGIFVEDSAWKHTRSYSDAYDEETASLLAGHHVDGELSLSEWLYAQPEASFVITERDADTMKFGIRLAPTSSRHLSGVLKRARDLDEPGRTPVYSAYVLHIGPGSM